MFQTSLRVNVAGKNCRGPEKAYTSRRGFLGGVLAVLGISIEISCGSAADVVRGLQIILDAIEIAEPIFAATGVIPAPLVPVLSEYLSQAAGFVVEVATELEGTDTPVEKIAFILAQAAKVVLPDVSGVMPAYANKFQMVQADVQTYVAPMPSFLRSPHTITPAKVRLGSGDRKALEKIKARAQAIAANNRAVYGK